MSILGTMVFLWGEMTIWFVLGVGRYPDDLNCSIDLIYSLAFIGLLNYAQSNLQLRKEELTKVCQQRKEEDANALHDQGTDSYSN